MTPAKVTERQYCDVHNHLMEMATSKSAIARFFTTRKLIAVVIAFVGACVSGIGYLIDKDIKAEGMRADIATDIQSNYVRREILMQSQQDQDKMVSVYMQETKERLNRVQTTVDETSKLVQRIAGKLDVQTTP